jgi:hypothetical protein
LESYLAFTRKQKAFLGSSCVSTNTFLRDSTRGRFGRIKTESKQLLCGDRVVADQDNDWSCF